MYRRILIIMLALMIACLSVPFVARASGDNDSGNINTKIGLKVISLVNNPFSKAASITSLHYSAVDHANNPSIDKGAALILSALAIVLTNLSYVGLASHAADPLAYVSQEVSIAFSPKPVNIQGDRIKNGYPAVYNANRQYVNDLRSQTYNIEGGPVSTVVARSFSKLGEVFVPLPVAPGYKATQDYTTYLTNTNAKLNQIEVLNAAESFTDAELNQTEVFNTAETFQYEPGKGFTDSSGAKVGGGGDFFFIQAPPKKTGKGGGRT